ncbi:MAG: SpoIIE family protein phosphatase [Streptomyces sp.]|nr:SpoIIE family protein phosphatase [Streptomyces sp.]
MSSTHLQKTPSRVRLPGDERAPSGARRFVRSAVAEQTAWVPPESQPVAERLADDAVLLVSELVTNAALYAGSEVEVACRVESAADHRPASRAGTPVAVVVEVTDRRPSAQVVRRTDTREDAWRDEHGRGLRIVAATADRWGVTYGHDQKTVWYRLADVVGEPSLVGPSPPLLMQEPAPGVEAEVVPHRGGRGAAAGLLEMDEAAAAKFLAESGELLAGQLDEDLVAALTGQLVVPRLADWCGVWLFGDSGEVRLSNVWTRDDSRLSGLRRALEHDPPPRRLDQAGVPWPWPDIQEAPDGTAPPAQDTGTAMAFPLAAGGRPLGTLVVGREGPLPMGERAVRVVEDLARYVAQSVAAARRYANQVAISRALQRRQLPVGLAAIPGIDSAIVYEPHAEGQSVGGDFYDLFPVGEGRWCFLLGDVMGSDAEAIFFTGLSRHLVRLLARENRGAESVLGKLNAAVAEEGEETMKQVEGVVAPHFVSMVYGELQPDPGTGGAHCTIASAGHPLPLRLSADGSVDPVARPQMLLGVSKEAEFHADSFYLAPGETLLCVTDGVTERRSGDRQLDDDDGLAEVLRGCRGLGATAVAERIRRTTHDFAAEPVDDDLAVLVIEPVPAMSQAGEAGKQLCAEGTR